MTGAAPLALASFDPVTFLRDYWQKRPLLIRNAWTHWQNPLDPDELAGLACEGDAEARLVIGAGAGLTVEHGPLAEERFETLGEADWTLLVQGVDRIVPAVAALIEPFRFVPDWRIDDVMVSYATDGGGVGPHFDQYDVFLVQGLGRRRWRVGGLCDRDTPLLPHDDLRLLAPFDAVEDWVLEPGDILYLPPRFAHEGVAIGGDCMTFSIGFRAPARSELIAHFCDDVLTSLDEDDRYGDPALSLQPNPGEIEAEALASLHSMIMDTLGDPAVFADWFGRYTSTPKNPNDGVALDEDWSPADARAAVAAGVPLVRNPASRFAFIRGPGGALTLFADGESFACDGPAAVLAEAICAGSPVALDDELALSDSAMTLLAALCSQGSIAFDDER